MDGGKEASPGFPGVAAGREKAVFLSFYDIL